jgi:SAM-dependent methyltransferase
MRGDTVECPCCGGKWKAMEPHRAREDARCPRCGSLERHRSLWLFLQRETDLLSRPLSVLHFAPEKVLADLLRDRANLSYVSGDLNAQQAMEVMDITAIPRPNATFDVVLCNHVLEHVPDDRRAISEIFRVLRSGGRAYMQHPIDYARPVTYENWNVVTPEARMREFGQEDHVRWYGADHIDRLRTAGFDVTCARYVDDLDEATAKRFALRDEFGSVRRADIYICRRPN